MSTLLADLDLRDPCPECFPGDAPAVTPLAEPVMEPCGSLRASYACPVCGHEWCCWWDAQSAGWPQPVPTPASRQGAA